MPDRERPITATTPRTRSLRALAWTSWALMLGALTGPPLAAAPPFLEFDQQLTGWVNSVQNWSAHAFEEGFTAPPGTGCASANGTVTMNVDGGRVSLEVSDNSCPLRDGTSSSDQVDATIPNGQTLTLTFDPPIHGFYGYYGSLASGSNVAMQVETASFTVITQSEFSQHNVLGLGHGFVSPEPVRVVSFTSTEAGIVHLGRFVGLLAGEPALEQAGGNCGPFPCDFAFARTYYRPRIFLTSSTGTGNLASWPEAGSAAGIEAGDTICRNQAAAAGLMNPQRFIAVLSDENHDLGCRIRGLGGTLANGCDSSGPLPSTGPWWRTDDAAFADLETLTAPLFLRRPLALDAHSATTAYWTGTREDLTYFPDWTCTNWSSEDGFFLGGLSAGVGHLWINGAGGTCGFPRSLACVEVVRGPFPLEEEPASGRVAFLSRASGAGSLMNWDALSMAPLNPLDAADSICQREAEEAGLDEPESFIAFLSSGGKSGFDRLTEDGAWSRPDGVMIAPHLAALRTFDWETAIPLHADGESARHAGVWTGTLGNQSAGANCDDWSTESGDRDGGHGLSTYFGPQSVDLNTSRRECSARRSLYCFSNAVDPGHIFFDGFEGGSTSSWAP